MKKTKSAGSTVRLNLELNANMLQVQVIVDIMFTTVTIVIMLASYHLLISTQNKVEQKLMWMSLVLQVLICWWR